MPQVTQSVFDLLAWREAEVPRVRALIAMRKFWSTKLYGRLRDEYERAIAGLSDGEEARHSECRRRVAGARRTKGRDAALRRIGTSASRQNLRARV